MNADKALSITEKAEELLETYCDGAFLIAAENSLLARGKNDEDGAAFRESVALALGGEAPGDA